MTEPCRLCLSLPPPPHLARAAAEIARKERPDNAPDLYGIRGFEPSPQRLALMTQYKWDRGKVVLIGFEGAPAGRATVATIMGHLEAGCAGSTISLREVPYGKAEVRVRFDRGRGLWSQIGTGALLVPAGQPTANLGDTNWGDPGDVTRVVLHEIWGHALGFVHAQNVRGYRVRFNVPLIVADLMRSQGWDRATAEAQWAGIADQELEQSADPLDRTSIMAYPVDPRYDLDGIGVGWNSDLSPEDRAHFLRVYGSRQVDGGDPPPPDPGTTATSSIRTFYLEYATGRPSRFEIEVDAGRVEIVLDGLGGRDVAVDVIPAATGRPTRIPLSRDDPGRVIAPFDSIAGGRYEVLVTVQPSPQIGAITVTI